MALALTSLLIHLFIPQFLPSFIPWLLFSVAFTKKMLFPSYPKPISFKNWRFDAFILNSLQRTFHYDSSFWNNKESFNLAGGETGFDSQETKLPTYWNTSFSKLCLGMKVSQGVNFLVMNKQVSSLFSLIADGQYRSTSLGRSMWKSLLVSAGSLQHNYNKEGLNTRCGSSSIVRARTGIISNNEYSCSGCDSRIAFGTGGPHDDSNTCGNEAMWLADNGNKHIKTFGYILVQ